MTPFRLCGKHNVALRVAYLPDREQGDTIDGITSYPLFQYLLCPVEGCKFVRPFKTPWGDRTKNRKTSRRNSAMNQQTETARRNGPPIFRKVISHAG